MKIGVSIPRLPDADGIREFCERAERLGFESVMAGDHIVLPVGGTNQYPYTPTGAFQRPSDEPFLETMTMLGFMAACTSEIRLGSTVLILPYRNPVVQAKMFASLDVLSGGRIICGGRRRLAGKGVRHLGCSLRRPRAHDRRVPRNLQRLVDRGKFPKSRVSTTRSTASISSRNLSSSHVSPSGSAATPGARCAAPRSTATAGTPPARPPTSSPRTCPTCASRPNWPAATRLT